MIISFRVFRRLLIPRKVKFHPNAQLATLAQLGKIQTIRRDLATLLQSCISGNCQYNNISKIHLRMVVAGLASDIFLNNILLNAYSHCDRLQEARLLFDRLDQRNLISWSTLISMYSQHGHGKETLKLFSEFRQSIIDSPNEFILASILRACAQSPDVDYAREIHCHVVKVGLNVDVYVGTALVNLYLKMGCMDWGKMLFDEMPVKNSITWTTIISGYSQNGNSETALSLFCQMKDIGVLPDRFVISSIISTCSSLSYFEGGRQIHGYAYRSGMELDISVSNVLIDFYAKCSRIKVAKKVFDRISQKNIVSWTTMIAGYMQNSYDYEALKLFQKMCYLGWRADAFACTSIMTSCGNLMALEQGKQVHAYAVRSDLVGDAYVKNGLIDMYAKCNSVVNARAIFDAIQMHDLISYNAMIEGYASQEELMESVKLFNMMRRRAMLPSSLTFVSILGVSASQGAIILSRQIHGLIIKSGVTLDLYSGSALVNVYSKCSYTDEARIVFEDMRDQDLVLWNAMICGYIQNAEGEKAIRLYQDLCYKGIKPNEYTFVSLVTAASMFFVFGQGLQIHAQIIKAGVDYDPHVSNVLADMYAKCGAMRESRELFTTAYASDVVCWNSIISRFAEHGHAEEALALFHQMQEMGITPNHVTFLGVLSACSHAGLIEDGLLYFSSMEKKFCIKPGVEHYACIVSLLGRAGRLQEAKEFVEKMPIEPSAIVWRTLLSSCKEFGDVALGKYAADMAIVMEPKDSGSYILLSNIFASKKMWTDVRKLRENMESTGVIKESGCSWIEIDMKVHTFISKDMLHPASISIYSALGGLTALIRDVNHTLYGVDGCLGSG